MIERIYKAIQEAGGKPYRVGGSVRDQIMGHTPKDVDTEVYGISTDTLIAILARFGKVNAVGASFGVIKLRVGDEEFDFSLPRRDNKTGNGHRGFMVEVDHAMTVTEAAARRDYTINAISIAPDGTIVDPYNGVADLKAGILRHTSAAFAEDPLRVLRGMQFAGRMNLTTTRETAAMCFSVRGEYDTLAKERVWGEWLKWATKSIVPSKGLEFLYATKWVYLYPELSALIGVPQDPIWHPEKNGVWGHTKHVCDAAAAIARREGLNEEDTAILVFGALAHDQGKPNTTKRSEASGRWIAPAHPEIGEPLSLIHI
jgi:tRNA nucleotidyltransferase (CCA-adding enzyme)